MDEFVINIKDQELIEKIEDAVCREILANIEEFLDMDKVEKAVLKGVREFAKNHLVPKESKMDEDVQGTANPIKLDTDTATQLIEQKKEKMEEAFAGRTFKSLQEASGWSNPQPDKYYVRPTTSQERRVLGQRLGYIVDTVPEKDPTGSFGNRKVKKAS